MLRLFFFRACHHPAAGAVPRRSPHCRRPPLLLILLLLLLLRTVYKNGPQSVSWCVCVCPKPVLANELLFVRGVREGQV